MGQGGRQRHGAWAAGEVGEEWGRQERARGRGATARRRAPASLLEGAEEDQDQDGGPPSRQAARAVGRRLAQPAVTAVRHLGLGPPQLPLEVMRGRGVARSRRALAPSPASPTPLRPHRRPMLHVAAFLLAPLSPPNPQLARSRTMCPVRDINLIWAVARRHPICRAVTYFPGSVVATILRLGEVRVREHFSGRPSR